MNKLFRSFVASILSLSVFLLLATPISANTDVNSEETQEPSDTGSVIELIPYGPTPFASFTGNFGTIRIDYMPSNRSIAWSVSSTGIDEFYGNIKVEDRISGTVRYYAVSGFGGVQGISVTKGRTYNVSLIGTGYALNGRPVASTVPNSIFVAP